MMLVPVPGGVAGDLTPDGNLGAYLDRDDVRTPPLGAVEDVGPRRAAEHGARDRDDAARRRGRTVARLARIRPTQGHGAGRGGLVAIGIGLAWSLVFPMNKNLWTSSYVWFTAGAGRRVPGAVLWLIDLRGWKAWGRPFVILGLNAIALFVLSGLLTKFLSPQGHRAGRQPGLCAPVTFTSRGSCRWPSPSTRRCCSRWPTSPCSSWCSGSWTARAST